MPVAIHDDRLKRRRIVFSHPLVELVHCPGDVITSVAQFAPYEERQGRLGLMLSTDAQNGWTNQQSQFVNGAPVQRLRHTTINQHLEEDD
jgi:hypothetical protein